MNSKIVVDAGLFGLIRNMLIRDAENGSNIRKEILEEMDKDAFIIHSGEEVIVKNSKFTFSKLE